MGSKLDNMNHVGHDVVIGKNCLIAAGSAIAGASTLEDDVILWGMVGIAKTTRIGRGTVIKPMSGVFQDVEAGKTIWGVPAIDSAVKMKEQIWMRRMPEIWEHYKQLTVSR
jgi:UDP-3-O-[3-hydroxymyristoyl] glucosamine N-acyltransferase